MPCPNCEALEDEIASLREQLMINDHEYSVLSAKHHLSLNEAWVMHRLYKNQGRPVAYWVLHENRPQKYTRGDEGSDKTIPVVIHRIRHKLGHNMIQTVAGQGYAITKEGFALIRDSLAVFS